MCSGVNRGNREHLALIDSPHLCEGALSVTAIRQGKFGMQGQEVRLIIEPRPALNLPWTVKCEMYNEGRVLGTKLHSALIVLNVISLGRTKSLGGVFSRHVQVRVYAFLPRNGVTLRQTRQHLAHLPKGSRKRKKVGATVMWRCGAKQLTYHRECWPESPCALRNSS